MATSSPLQGGRALEPRQGVDVSRAGQGDAGTYDGEYGDDAKYESDCEILTQDQLPSHAMRSP